MKILALESSAVACSVCLWEDGRLLAQSFQNSGLTHSRTLMSLCGDLLKNGGYTLDEVDVVAVAAAKGLAWAGDKLCAGVSTLEAMAWPLAHLEGADLCAVMDARRQQVYNALFEVRGGALLRRCPDRAVSVEQLAAELEVRKKPQILVGDGTKLCYNELTKRGLPMEPAPPHLVFQSAWGVALAAAELAGRGGLVTAAGLEPVYHRLSQAERERLARQGKAEKCKGDN